MKSFELKNLMEGTAEKITANEKEWKLFLQTASRFIKYNFDAQLLIYVQKPDATACATVEVWKKFQCWVRKGAKGIGLINQEEKVTYIFDIKDVHHGKNGQYPYIWKIAPEERAVASHMLQEIYGTQETNLFKQLQEIVGKGSEDDREQILIRNSILYMLLYRCGLLLEEEPKLDFKGISDYGSVLKLCKLGKQITEGVLPIMNNFNNIMIGIYSEKGGEEIHDRDKIQESRRISASRFRNNRLPEGETGKIWGNASSLFEGESGGQIYGHATDSRAISTSDRNAEGSKGQVQDNHSSNGRAGGDYGTYEGYRLDALHNVNEQHSAHGGENRTEGDNLQLKIGDTIQEKEEAVGNRSAAFSNEENKENRIFPRAGGVKERFRNNMEAINLLHNKEKMTLDMEVEKLKR